MRRAKVVTLGEAIREYMKLMQFTQKRQEASMQRHWEKVVGPVIYSYTSEVFVRNKVLFVHLKSAALRSELLMNQNVLKENLNKEAGEEVITKIIFK